MDLINWPPEPGYAGGRGISAPLLGQVSVKKVIGTVGRRVSFDAAFERWEYHYFLESPDETTAKKLATILENSIGKDLLSIGMIEIPED
jgi:hypothetical protein